MEKTLKLLIKGMVCNRCIYVLSEEFAKLGLEVSEISLGEVILKETGKKIEEQVIRAMLKKNGFELLYSKNQKIINLIKNIVEKGIQEQLDTAEPVKFSTLISNELHKDYDSLSFLFSTSEGYTLEKFIISKKIEKVKELLVYTDQSMTEITSSLGYNNPAHLSNQLKKYTGFTSSYYKQIRRDKMNIVQNQFRKNNSS
ncbi:AraC family transcriptional regulator [Flavobacterium sp. LS1R47]|jgi:AraC-like DNA-binding protein|uniref:AraC family transcriptional regulator n=1 Tax=Flavobacterium frigoritolerans TaxID=2987686 RepID=A0A9X3C9K0_9FLAO|nr:AraC family transcriptional regulator [Flavobacterium frigoritolerans]MCV9934106.1 AraC family transcriptional regulator [Flavobacterium frigoritolerans]